MNLANFKTLRFLQGKLYNNGNDLSVYGKIKIQPIQRLKKVFELYLWDDIITHSAVLNATKYSALFSLSSVSTVVLDDNILQWQTVKGSTQYDILIDDKKVLSL